jgi:hypothetical protein
MHVQLARILIWVRNASVLLREVSGQNAAQAGQVYSTLLILAQVQSSCLIHANAVVHEFLQQLKALSRLTQLTRLARIVVFKRLAR